MVRRMVMVLLSCPMDPRMKDNGKMINRMDKELRNGKMDRFTEGNLSMG